MPARRGEVDQRVIDVKAHQPEVRWAPRFAVVQSGDYCLLFGRGGKRKIHPERLGHFRPYRFD
ncbi:hypothetical protein GCM10027521_11120 [Amycolatopsis cihanbeyliensis]